MPVKPTTHTVYVNVIRKPQTKASMIGVVNMKAKLL
jgi:hypothetical protein